MLKFAPKASPSVDQQVGRSTHVGVFETNQIQQDLRALLADFGISVLDYQRLEFLFRQALMQSSATLFEYSHFEELIDFRSKPSPSQIFANIDESLENWHLRYPDRDYGFEKVDVFESAGKLEARRAYRKALRTFDEIFSRVPSRGMKEAWLRELTDKLRFHVVAGTGHSSQLNAQNGDYLVAYMGFADAVFYPFFMRHFENKRLTTERYFEFLSLKLSVEAGEFVVPSIAPLETSDFLTNSVFTDEVDRLQILPSGWLDQFSRARAA